MTDAEVTLLKLHQEALELVQQLRTQIEAERLNWKQYKVDACDEILAQARGRHLAEQKLDDLHRKFNAVSDVIDALREVPYFRDREVTAELVRDFLKENLESAHFVSGERVVIHGVKQTNVSTISEVLNALRDTAPWLPVYIDNKGQTPGALCSYRGYYDQLAIIPHATISPKVETCIVDAFRTMMTKAIGQVFQGYKGGDNTMKEDTKVWVSAWGEVSNLALCSIEEHSDHVLLITREDI